MAGCVTHCAEPLRVCVTSSALILLSCDLGALSLPQSEGRDPGVLFPGGAGRPLVLNLTRQVPVWREEVRSAGLGRGGRGPLGGW